MPEPVVPGFGPKAALFTARVAHKPFEVPAKMTNGSLAAGGAAHHVFGKGALTLKEGFESLQPRFGAQLITKFFDKMVASTDKSVGKAQTNTEVFWKPFSIKSDELGTAVTGPGAYIYAKAAGFPEPSNPELLAQLLHTKGYPTPPPASETPPAPPAAGTPTPPASDAPAPPAGDKPPETPAPPAGDTPPPASETPAPPAGDTPPETPAPPAGDKPPETPAPPAS